MLLKKVVILYRLLSTFLFTAYGRLSMFLFIVPTNISCALAEHCNAALMTSSMKVLHFGYQTHGIDCPIHRFVSSPSLF